MAIVPVCASFNWDIAREGFSFGNHLNRSVESLAEQLGETVLAATVEGKQLLYLA